MSSEKLTKGRPPTSADPKKLGGKIRLAREKGGFTKQIDFAMRVGISRVSLSRIETNKQNPDPQTLFVINQVLGTNFIREDADRVVSLPRQQASKPSEADKYTSLPFLGWVTAGGFIDAKAEEYEEIEVPRWMTRKGREHGCVRVRGDSMRDGGVFAGDVLIITPEYEPHERDLVVVETAKGATLKRWAKHGDTITLTPENPDYEPMQLHAKKVKRVHHVVGVLRAVK